MAVNKVVFGDQTIMDISDSTVNANNLLSGVKAYGANGEAVTGAVVTAEVVDNLTTQDANKALSANQGYVLDQKKIDKTASEIVVDTSGQFNTVTGGILDSCNVNLDPIQDLHGYSKPWVGGSGKNKQVMTVQGIKSANTSGSWSGNVYTINGGKVEILTDSDNNVIGLKVSDTFSSSSLFYIEYFDVNGNYLLSGCPSGGSSSTYRLDLRNSSNGVIETDIGSGRTVNNISGSVRCVIRIEGGYTANNLIFYPMIRLATVTDATFEPYTNICGITGHSSVEVGNVGINLLNPVLQQTESAGIRCTDNHDGTFTLNGTITSYTSIFPLGTFNVRSGMRLIGCPSGGSDLKYELCVVNSDGTAFIARDFGSGVTINQDYDGAVIRLVVRQNQGSVSNLVFKPMITYDENASYINFAPYLGKTYTISLGQTVYGCKFDAVSGVLTVDSKVLQITSQLSPLNRTALGTYCRYYYTVDNAKTNTQGIYSHGIYKENYSEQSSHYYVPNATQLIVFIPGETTTDADNYISNQESGGTPLTVVYPLATPLTIQLTPQQIETLIGQNNISIPLTGQSLVSLTYREVMAWDDAEDTFADKAYNADYIRSRNLSDQSVFVVGSINGTGQDTTSDRRLRSPLIGVKPNTAYGFSVNSGLWVMEIDEYDVNGLWLRYSAKNTQTATHTFGADAYFTKILVKKSDNSAITDNSILTQMMMNEGVLLPYTDYIKSNVELDTDKISSSAIVDNLTTNDATKVLSAKQGKALQDGKINVSDKSISVLEAIRGNAAATSKYGYWASMAISNQQAATLPTTGKWWHVLNMDWDNRTNNWVSQLALPTQDGSGIWWRRNDSSNTEIDASTWHRLAEGNSYGDALKSIADKNGNDITTTYLPLSGGTLSGPNVVKFTADKTTAVNYDSRSLSQLPISKYRWHDLFAFCKKGGPSFYVSADNTNWTEGTVDKQLFSELESTAVNIIKATGQCGARWIWDNNSYAWCNAKWLLIGNIQVNNAATITITFETSSDGTNWTIRHQSSTNNQNIYTYCYLEDFGGEYRFRLTIIKDASNTTDICNINSIKLLTPRLAGQGGGQELEYPYVWDKDGNISSISAGNLDLGASNNYWKNGYFTNINGVAVGNSPKFTDTTYSAVSKTSNGLCPQLPNETATSKFLRQDGTWAEPSGGSGSNNYSTTKTAVGTWIDGRTIYKQTFEETISAAGTKSITVGSNIDFLVEGSAIYIQDYDIGTTLLIHTHDTKNCDLTYLPTSSSNQLYCQGITTGSIGTKDCSVSLYIPSYPAASASNISAKLYVTVTFVEYAS